MNPRIQTHLEIVELSEVAHRMHEILEEHFSAADDWDEPREKNLTATVAARLAVKRAVAALHGRHNAGPPPSLKRFAVKKDARGAPYVVGGELPVKISMAHTKSRAYGMAVYEEAGS